MAKSICALQFMSLLTALLGQPAQAEPLEIHQGDHISIIGNTLAERMQHDGWLETFLHSRFPKHDLVIRNLGFSGDELTLRLRSQDFGTPDQHLTFNRTDVVFAFFGYNESFGDEKGLPKFKKDLADFITHTRSQKYNGKSAPRLVLFSPVAHEDLGDPNLPNGSENNRRLKLYVAAMAEVARASHVPFVDFFSASRSLYDRSETPLTINGIHLNEEGNRLIGLEIDRILFGSDIVPNRASGELEKLRQAVLDKNFHWFHRYRTTDGYSMYGGRADLKFVNGQTNREVMQRELEVLDVMTANRDKRIWAVAQGGDLKVDDSNTPPFIEVITNKPGPLPGGKHLFASGEEAIEKMTIAKGMKVNLVASEKEFPELVNPVQMAFDTKGRLWVAVWPTYPHWKPKEAMDDKLLILEDTNGDGKADKCKTFAGGLHNPTGFEFWGGGVFVSQAPDLMFLKDTDGDDKADVRLRVIHGIDSADTHHTANSFVIDPGGALYFQEGTFHHSQVETLYSGPVRLANAGVFRYEPRTHKFDSYITYGFANPHGHAFDRWGQDIVVDGTGSNPYHAALFSGRMDFPHKHATPPQVYQQRTRPCPAIEYLSSRHFPDEMQGNLLVQNVIGFQGILQYKIEDRGSSFSGTEVEPMLSSSDPSFRPVDMEVGPDGAVYFVDWQNPIIGHMQHNLRDPSRDREHGRVYRVTYPSRPLSKPLPIAGEPIETLLECLKEPEDRVRYRARIELSGRPSDQVLAAVKKWMTTLNRNDPDYERQLLEALWLHQGHNVVSIELLDRMLASPEFRARAAGTRVLCYWRDRVPNVLDRLRQLAADQHPRVRLEAVRAASFFTAPEAVEIPLIAAEYPTDQYLDYTRGETMKTLEPYWKSALAAGTPIPVTTEEGARFILRNLSAEQLLKSSRNRTVYLELLFRPGLQDDQRHEALRGLASNDKKTEIQILFDAIKSIDEKRENRDESIVFDLARLLTARRPDELAQVRGELERLATAAKQPIIRQVGFVTLMTVDVAADKAWQLALRSAASLRDLLGAVPLIQDASLRASLYPKIEPLLTELPKELADNPVTGKGATGRFVRIELPGSKTLTLAEVEVYSNGRNVARQGKASQKDTAHGGRASRAIDGNKSGSYDDGGQTHTREGTTDPWWELDLGEEVPVESVVVYNRTDGYLGNRLRGFTLKLLDAKRNEMFVQRDNLAPVNLEFSLGGGPANLIRWSAMEALTSIRGQEQKTFQTLAGFVRKPADRLAAIRALQRIPRNFWPKEEAPALVETLLANIRTIPPQDRTTPAALDTIEFADALAALLPRSEAAKARAQLGELAVRVIRVGTLFERMSYDKETIAVKAGKPVEILFENTDLMPHNLVITQPGAMEEIGQTAEATATHPDAAARHYVPQSSKILLASRLLQPRDFQKLSFTAPKQPGVYPFVCTYPGHWRRMFGALYVVENLDEYLASPESYLASHSLPVKDDLLKDRRPRTEWTFNDLAASVAELKGGRSYGSGKQMFQVANCIACHRHDGVGNQFGPDLTQLDPKLPPVEILRELIDPSLRINEKFQTNMIELSSGKILTALVLEETPEVVKVIENPLTGTQVMEIKRSEIVSREKSMTSIMPKGLLDRLNREEILDLIAYVAARGNRNAPYFQGNHHQHGHEH